MINIFSWFSADVDTGEVVAKTDVHDDGSVSRYEYTVPDKIDEGHGHKEYEDMDDFMDDNLEWERDKDAPESIGREWHGNGFELYLKSLKKLDEEKDLYDTDTLVLKRVIR